MLYHIVAFKFRPNVTPAECAKFYAGVESLKHIEGVISAQCGEISTSLYPNFNDRAKGYTHSMLVVVKDAEALERYDKHPIHEQVKASCILPCVDKGAENAVAAFDYFGKLTEETPEDTKASTFGCSTWLAIALSILPIAGFAFMRHYHSRL